MEKVKKVVDKLRKRSVEEAVSYAVAHANRVDILCFLNEKPRSPSELSKLMGLALGTIEHHVNELLASSSIELDHVEKVRNAVEHFYRAVEIPFFTDEEMWSMPPEVRQEIYGLILQTGVAEALGAFRAEKINHDPWACMAWRWFDLDETGRKDMAEENARTWNRRLEIESEAAQRSAETGAKLESIVVTLFAHWRCRTARGPRRDPETPLGRWPLK